MSELKKTQLADQSEFKYTESDSVKQALSLLQQQQAQKPGAYQSQWQTQIQDTLDKIMNREKFTYDLNGDALYQQYKNQYKLQGQQAMMDTMGQAAALTGGYGNSYAQTAGQQAYQGHLQKLNDKIPELYQLALSKYQAEGQDLLTQYGLLQDREAQDYGRYRDNVSDYNTELARLQSNYDNERSFDYGMQADKYAYGYQAQRDAVADRQTAYSNLVNLITSTGYTPTTDELAAAGMSEAQAAAYRQYYADQTRPVSSTGNSGGQGASYDNGGVAESVIKRLQKLVGATEDGKWGADSRAKAKAKYGIEDPAELYKSLWGKGSSGENGAVAAGVAGAQKAAATTDANAVSNFKASIKTNREFARSGGSAQIGNKTYQFDSYEEYVEAVADNWLASGKLSEAALQQIMASL